MSVGKSSLWFASGTVLSRLSGVVRDSVVAGVFGASTAMDAFIVAFRIPNLLRDMVAEGALSSAFTKVYSSLSVVDAERAKKLLADAMLLTAVAGIIICTLGSYFADDLVHLMTAYSESTGASNPSFQNNAIALTRLLFPYLFFPMLGAVVIGALHQHGNFFVSGMAPIGLNVGFIVGALMLAPLSLRIMPSEWMQNADSQIIGLAVGVLLGGVLSLSIELWGLRRLPLNLFHQLRTFYRPSEDVRRVVKIMIPAAIAAGVGPINITISTNFATSLETGAVTWLNYAFRLLQLPIGVFSVAIASAALPAMARSIAKASHQIDSVVSQQLQNALELVIWLMAGCMAIMLANSQEIIQLLFQHAKFGADDTKATADALFLYSLGMMGYGLTKVLTSFYFAVERTSFALRVSLVSIVVNFAGNYFLVSSLGHLGLAATASISLTVNAAVLWVGLRRHQIQWQTTDLRRTILITALAATAAIAGERVCRLALDGLAFESLISQKFLSAVSIALNVTIVLAIMTVAAAIRWRTSPQQILKNLRSRRQKNV